MIFKAKVLLPNIPVSGAKQNMNKVMQDIMCPSDMFTNNKFIGLDNFFLDGINTKMKAFVKNPIVRMIEHMMSIRTLETTSLYARPASCIRIKKTVVADWLYSEIPFTFCKHDTASVTRPGQTATAGRRRMNRPVFATRETVRSSADGCFALTAATVFGEVIVLSSICCARTRLVGREAASSRTFCSRSSGLFVVVGQGRSS